jgi:hypothetical protein
MTSRLFSLVLFVSLFAPTAAFSQSFEVGGHITSARWSEFEGNDLGLGGRLTWRPSSMVGFDAGLTWYPSDFPEGFPFTASRVEGLFGVSVGPRVHRIRPFVKAAAGFLKVGAASQPFPCIAIFPPPLNCALGGGDTLPAFEIGGGVEINATPRTFIRVDVSDRILRYPGPTFDSNFEIRDEGILGHAIRFTLGAGLRF